MNSIFDKDVDDKKALAELRKLVKPIPVVKKVSGNFDAVKNQIVLGCQAGPSMEVDNAIHELGHLIVASDENCNKPSWGIGYKKWVNCPVTRMGGYYEVNTCQDVQMEAKVWAIQTVFRKKIGYLGENLPELVKSADFLLGFIYVKPKGSDAERYGIIVKWIEEMLTKKEYQIDYLLSELKRKKKLVMKHLKTS